MRRGGKCLVGLALTLASFTCAEDKNSIDQPETQRQRHAISVLAAGGEMNPEYVKVIIDIVGIIVGVVIIVYQLGRQHRSAIKLQQENFRQEQRVELFDQIAKKVEAAQTAIAELSAMGHGIPNEFDLYKIVLDAHAAQPQHVPYPRPIRTTGNDLVKLYSKVAQAVCAVVNTIESREILNPDFSIFRLVIVHQSQQCSAAYMAFQNKIIPYLSIPTPERLRSSPMAPSTQDYSEMKNLGQNFFDEYFILLMYLSDLIVETQNCLLGQLFENHLPMREPLDPKYLVISTDIGVMKKIEERLEFAKRLPPEKLPSRLAELRRSKRKCRWFHF